MRSVAGAVLAAVAGAHDSHDGLVALDAHSVVRNEWLGAIQRCKMVYSRNGSAGCGVSMDSQCCGGEL